MFVKPLSKSEKIGKILMMGKVLTRKQIFSFFSILFFFLTLPFFVILVQKTVQYLSQAQGVPANIYIDTQGILGPMPRPWSVLAQGSEEPGRMLQPVISQLQEISPKYIRIDHIFNRYHLVSRQQDGRLNFDFSLLDQTVDDILNCGALPFFSLSYIPETLSVDGSITSPPKDWEEWSLAVQNLVEHYSSKEKKNLANLYYEVFNEPDLFGRWTINGQPNYLTLYHHTALGAQRVENTNHFFLGGPATTSFYPNWIKGLLKYTTDHQLKLDFISWHRYSLQPDIFPADGENADLILTSSPQFAQIQKLITEFGFDSENNPAHDTNLSAAHLVTVIKELLGKVDLAFTFEAKDGPSPQGIQFWGRWGILTHQGQKKPRFYALALLNKMGRHRLNLWGEGTWVQALASQELGVTRVLVVNFDPKENHSEMTPINFLNLEKGVYTLTQVTLSGETLTTGEVVTEDNLKKEIVLPPNEVVFLELEKIPMSKD